MARFVKFILTEIFPGGYLPTIELVGEHATKSGFNLTRTQSLQPHYARTLDLWAAALEAHKDEAIAVQSEEVYDRYMHYLTGCARFPGRLHRRQSVHPREVAAPAGGSANFFFFFFFFATSLGFSSPHYHQNVRVDASGACLQ